MFVGEGFVSSLFMMHGQPGARSWFPLCLFSPPAARLWALFMLALVTNSRA